MTGENIFVKIRNDEKTSIFTELADRRTILNAKYLDPNGVLFLIEAENFSNNQLRCHFKEHPKPYPQNQPLIVQFATSWEKYLFQDDTKFQGDTLYLDAQADLFRLQRREDFRLKLPSSFNALFTITVLNGDAGKMDVTILDISAGGLRISAQRHLTHFTKGDHFEGKLQLKGRPPIMLKLEAMHVITDPMNEKLTQVGCRFRDISPIEKNKFTALVMDLYREIYSRM